MNYILYRKRNSGTKQLPQLLPGECALNRQMDSACWREGDITAEQNDATDWARYIEKENTQIEKGLGKQ